MSLLSAGSFFFIDLHICCLILTVFQDFKGFFGGWLSFVPKHLVFFTTETRLTLFLPEESLWSKEEGWTSG